MNVPTKSRTVNVKNTRQPAPRPRRTTVGQRPLAIVTAEPEAAPAAMPLTDLAGLPSVLDLPTAARVLGIGRTLAYELIRADQWPSPVLRVGRLIKIPTPPLLALLGVDQSRL